MRRVFVAFLVGVLAAAGGCGSDDEGPPTVAVGAKPPAGAPLTLGPYPPGDLALDGASWPRACALFGDDDVRTVLPQATRITRAGAAKHVRWEYPQQQPPRTETIVVPENSCVIG